MSQGGEPSQESNQMSRSKSKRQRLSIEESNQNLSMNVNCPSTSKKRLSDDHGDGSANPPITEFRASEPHSQHQFPDDSSANKAARGSSNAVLSVRVDVRKVEEGHSAENDNIDDRTNTQTNQTGIQADHSNQSHNLNDCPPAKSNSNQAGYVKCLQRVHKEGKLGPIEREKMEDDEEGFDPIQDINQRSIKDYLEGSFKQTNVDSLLLFCSNYYSRNNTTNEQFQKVFSPFLYIEPGYPLKSRGSQVGDYLVRDGLFLLAYAKYTAGNINEEPFFSVINAFRYKEQAKTHASEFEDAWQTHCLRVSIDRSVEASERRKQAFRESQRVSQEGLVFEEQGTGNASNNPKGSGINSSRKKKVAKKRDREKDRQQKKEKDNEHLGMAYTHKIIDNEIVVVKKSLRRNRHDHSNQRSQEAKAERSKKKSHVKVVELQDINVQEVISHIDSYSYKPKFPTIFDNSQPYSQEDEMIHEALEKRRKLQEATQSEEESQAVSNSHNAQQKMEEEAVVQKTPPPHAAIQEQSSYSNKVPKSFRKSHRQENNKRSQERRSPARNKRRSPPQQKDKSSNRKSKESQKLLEAHPVPNQPEPRADSDNEEAARREQAEIQKRIEEFKKYKHKFAPPDFIEPIVEVIDPNVDNLGIYALVKLDPLTSCELRDQFAVVPLPTFPKKDIDVERYQLIHKTRKRCYKIANRQSVAWIAYTEKVAEAIAIEQEKRKKQRRLSQDNMKITRNMVESPSLEYLERPMNKYPSKQSKFSETKFHFDDNGKLREVIAPGCPPSKSKPKPRLSYRQLTESIRKRQLEGMSPVPRRE